MIILVGMKIFWIIVGSSQKWTCLGVILCIVWSFHKVNVQNGNIFGVAEISNIFGGMPDIPDMLMG